MTSKKRTWKGRKVPKLQGNIGWENILAQHGADNQCLLREATPHDKRIASDTRLRKVYLAWKRRTPMPVAVTDYAMNRIRVEIQDWFDTQGEQWLESIELAMDEYFKQARQKMFEGIRIRLSFSDFWENKEELSKEKTSLKGATVYSDLSHLSADDVRGEGECAVELGQRDGRPNLARQILGPARRKAVGLKDEPKT